MQRRKKKTVLVTGAGGSIGKETLRLLLRRRAQYNIRVFDLDNLKNREYFDRLYGKITPFYGDISNKKDTIEALRGVDVVIHLASVIPPLARYNPDLVERINVGGTRNLVENMEAVAPKAFLLFASSVAVYGDRLSSPYITVKDPIAPAEGDVYAEGKVRMEEIIQKSSLAWSIFRLCAIMDAKKQRPTPLMFVMPLRTPMEIATPRDTARAFVKGVHHTKDLKGRIFNLGGGSECVTTYYDFLNTNFRIFGLGSLDFPPHSFATKNFHCGIYKDGDDLEQILHFRRDTIEDYYDMVRQNTPAVQRWATKLLAKLIKSYLLSKSEPYQAWLSDDEELRKFFFN